MSSSNIPTSLDYSRLLVDSLNRGGLHIVDVEPFRYFRQLKFTIKPYLNIRQFCCTKLSTEKSLISELCENCKVLLRSWFRALFLNKVKVDTSFAIDDLDAELLQFFKVDLTLPYDQAVVLMYSISVLYFKIKVRKWSFLKAYKDRTKLKQSLGQAKSSTSGRSTNQSAELHGKGWH